MSMIRKLASETAIYGLSSIVGRFLNYLLVPIHTAVFLPSQFVSITELYAWAALLMVLFTHGMETAYFNKARVASEERKAYGSAWGSVLLWASLATIPLILFSDSIGSAVKYESNPEYIIYFALIIWLDAASAIPFAKLRFQERAWTFALIRLLSIGINIGITAYFLLPNALMENFNYQLPWNAFDPSVGIAYVFIANLTASSVMFLALLFTNRPYITLNKEMLGEMLPYALPMMIAGFAGIINETLDKGMMKWLLPGYDLGQVGIYGACYKLAILMNMFTQAYRYAAEPFFFRSASEENAEQKYALAARYFTIAGVVIFMLVMMYIDIFKYFIHPNFHEGLHIVPILLFANLFLGLYYNTSVWYKLTNKTRWGAYIGILGALITIVMNIMLVPEVGYIGAAWATLICYAFMLIISFIAGRKYMPVPYEYSKIIGYIVLAWGAWEFSNYWYEISRIDRILLNTIVFISFLVLIYLSEKLVPGKSLKSNNT